MLKAGRKSRERAAIRPPNLTSVMDCIFILIFYFLTYISFQALRELISEVPIVSESEPKDDKKPLALNLRISPASIEIYTGVPAKLVNTLKKDETGNYPLDALHGFLIDLKKKFPKEKLAIFEPDQEISYEDIVKIMDAVRLPRKTDDSIYIKENNMDIQVEELFSEIIFGNIQS